MRILTITLVMSVVAPIALAQDCPPEVDRNVPDQTGPRGDGSPSHTPVHPPSEPEMIPRPPSFGDESIDPWAPPGGFAPEVDLGSWEDWGLPDGTPPMLSPKQNVVKGLGRTPLVNVGKTKKDPKDQDTVSPGSSKRRRIDDIDEGQTFGTQALESCIGVLVIDGSRVYVAHIMPGNDANAMLDELLDGLGKGASGVIAGGNDDEASVEQLEKVIDKLKEKGVTVAGFADCEGIHVVKDDMGNLAYARYEIDKMKSGK